ncbi:unnamed protein product, partial [Brenthis ino]
MVRWSGGVEARAARVSRDHIRWRTRVAEEAWRVARGACNAAMHRGAKPTQPQERKLENATRTYAFQHCLGQLILVAIQYALMTQFLVEAL